MNIARPGDVQKTRDRKSHPRAVSFGANNSAFKVEARTRTVRLQIGWSDFQFDVCAQWQRGCGLDVDTAGADVTHYAGGFTYLFIFAKPTNDGHGDQLVSRSFS